MTVPGSNLLNRAFKLIARQTFSYYAFVSRAANSVGLLNATYEEAQTLKGSIQPVPRAMYVALGLDLQKNYFNIYVSQNVIDVRRDVSGDYIVFNSKKLQCESITAWFEMDGWNQILSVEVQS